MLDADAVTQVSLFCPFERALSSMKLSLHVQDVIVVFICKWDCEGPEGSRISEFPPTGQVHNSLRVIFVLQLPENRQVLTINTGQWGIVDRVIAISRGVLV